MVPLLLSAGEADCGNERVAQFNAREGSLSMSCSVTIGETCFRREVADSGDPAACRTLEVSGQRCEWLAGVQLPT